MPTLEDASNWTYSLTGWNNEPAEPISVKDAEISMQVPPKTDCWRKTRNSITRDNAPFHWQTVSGDFEIVSKISGDLSNIYDKAGLMVRVDEENWILSGLEFFNSTMNHSTCITKDHTDWSLTPLPTNAEKVGIWFKIIRVGKTVECLYSIDGSKWVQTRECLFFDTPNIQVGICAGSPIGDGFTANFAFCRCNKL